MNSLNHIRKLTWTDQQLAVLGLSLASLLCQNYERFSANDITRLERIFDALSKKLAKKCLIGKVGGYATLTSDAPGHIPIDQTKLQIHSAIDNLGRIQREANIAANSNNITEFKRAYKNYLQARDQLIRDYHHALSSFDKHIIDGYDSLLKSCAQRLGVTSY